MQRHGELVQWNNKGGYGFVRDDTGRDYYVHISKVLAGTRPRIGDKLAFEVTTSRKGRPSAIGVSIATAAPQAPPTLRDAMHKPANVSRFAVGLRTSAATMMTLLLLWAVGAGHISPWAAMTYAGMGVASALLYRFDKLYAVTGKWRVSETNLHVVDLCFGIIGGLSAQEIYRHKTVKPRFVATTWAIALVHTLGLAALAFGWLDAALPLLR